MNAIKSLIFLSTLLSIGNLKAEAINCSYQEQEIYKNCENTIPDTRCIKEVDDATRNLLFVGCGYTIGEHAFLHGNGVAKIQNKLMTGYTHTPWGENSIKTGVWYGYHTNSNGVKKYQATFAADGELVEFLEFNRQEEIIDTRLTYRRPTPEQCEIVQEVLEKPENEYESRKVSSFENEFKYVNFLRQKRHDEEANKNFTCSDHPVFQYYNEKVQELKVQFLAKRRQKLSEMNERQTNFVFVSESTNEEIHFEEEQVFELFSETLPTLASMTSVAETRVVVNAFMQSRYIAKDITFNLLKSRLLYSSASAAYNAAVTASREAYSTYITLMNAAYEKTSLRASQSHSHVFVKVGEELHQVPNSYRLTKRFGRSENAVKNFKDAYRAYIASEATLANAQTAYQAAKTGLASSQAIVSNFFRTTLTPKNLGLFGRSLLVGFAQGMAAAFLMELFSGGTQEFDDLPYKRQFVQNPYIVFSYTPIERCITFRTGRQRIQIEDINRLFDGINGEGFSSRFPPVNQILE